MNDIILELSALLLSLFCFVYSITVRRKLYLPLPKGFLENVKSSHTPFILLLVTVMVCSASSVLGSIGHYFGFDAWLLEFFHTLYYAFHNMLAVFFCLYILNMSGPVKKLGRLFFILYLLPFLAGEAIILSNPFTHLCFYVDEALVYHRGSALVLLYAIAGVYIVSGYIYFVIFSRSMRKTDRNSTLIFISVAIAGVVIQAVWSVLVELFFESIAFMGFMALLERDKNSKEREMSERLRRILTLAIVLTFISVIAMNALMIFRLTSTQSNKIGGMLLESIRHELQDNVSNAERNILQLEIGAEQLLDNNADMAAYEAYLVSQSEALRADESYMTAYMAGEDWSLFLPDVVLPDDFRASERVWFIGAKENAGKVCISEPYEDAFTGDICFTASTLLSDGETVVAIDMNFSQVQNSIAQITEEDGRNAMLVTADGVIAGYPEVSFVGLNVNDVIPEYSEVLRRVSSSAEHGSFSTRINGRSVVVFSSETTNGWFLILAVETSALYRDNYKQMATMVAVNFLMLVVLVVFYSVSVRNRSRYAKQLNEKEKLTKGLINSLREYVSNIIRLSDWRLIEKSNEPSELVGSIKESGLRISDAINNYSAISSETEIRQEDSAEQDAKRSSVSIDIHSKRTRNHIVVVLMIALGVGLFIGIRSTVRFGNNRMEYEVDSYETRLNEWVAQQKSLLFMFTDLLSSKPELLDDHDGVVSLLDDVYDKHPEIASCYIADPYSEYPLIKNSSANTGKADASSSGRWYRDTELSPDGFNLTEPFFDEGMGEYLITFSRTVYGDGDDFLGIVGIDFRLQDLISILDQSYSGTGYAFLVDSSHEIVNHPNESYRLGTNSVTSIEDTEYAEAYNSEGVTLVRDYDGRYVTCMCRKNASGLTVMVANVWWSMYGSVAVIVLSFVIIFGVCIFFIILLINRLIRWQDGANRRLVEAAEEAVNAGKAKTQFLAQMSHEIRTPINAVLGMNDMIMNASTDNEILEYSSNIKNAGNTLLSLINSILDFSKIEDGKMEIINVHYETLGLIDELVKMFSERAVKKGLDLLLDVDPALPSVLYGDDIRIRQVLSNLLSNAVKYTNDGSVTLSVRAENTTDDECDIVFSVADTGIGIREEDVEKLFTSFLRLEQERNRNIEGTGLGIAIVQRLLVMMGSKLEVKSTYGKGSTFSFRLKQKVVDRAAIGSYESHHNSVLILEKTRRTVHAPDADVLVVDDNELNLKVAKGLLKRSDITPDLAGSGPKCLEMASYKHYDIIFMDHMMPGMDGIQTLKVLKERGSVKDNTAVIVLTANAIVGAREQYIKAGFVDYLSKPIDYDELQQMLFNYLPKEKVVWENAQKNDSSDNGEEYDPISTLGELGFNTDEGLRYAAGDRAFYLDLISSFASEQATKDRAIEDAVKLRDLHGYEILVHALKSSSRMIGADKLSELAFDQELAAKNNDEASVLRTYSELIALDRETASKIRQALAAHEETEKPEDAAEGSDIDPNRLKGVIGEAVSCLNRFEVERASQVLNQYSDSSFRGTRLGSLFREALDSLDEFETEKAAELLRDIMKTI